MHGIIFASLHDYSRGRLGAEATREIFAGQTYAMSEQHPDSEFTDLLERIATFNQQPVRDTLREFGAYTAEHTFARLYPAYFELAADTRTFLLGVETRIHELVRATIPQAQPPALRIRPAGDNAISIDYSSPRRLCHLLEGLVIGTGRHYRQQVTTSETTCMHTGAPACHFNVKVASSP